MGRCPFHHEKTGSFHVDLKTGKWNCFGCGESGNFVSFWAKYHGVDTKEAYKAILDKYGVSREPPKPAMKKEGRDVAPYSLEQYAQDKRLPKTSSGKYAGPALERTGTAPHTSVSLTLARTARKSPTGSATPGRSFAGATGAAARLAFTESGGFLRYKRPAGPSWSKEKATRSHSGTWASLPLVPQGPPCSRLRWRSRSRA